MNDSTRTMRGKGAELAGVLRGHLPELKERYGVEALGIFGSYAHGAEREGSDLDVLVEFSRSTDLFEFVELKLHLSDLLGVEVDLVMRRALKPRIGERILREVIQL